MDLTAEKTIHTLRSSNLPFYSAIWEAAKASESLVTFHKRFYWDNKPTRDSKKAAQNRCALVDIVSCDGEEWIKVSTITESRLVFEIAKAQWESANSSSDEDEGGEVIAKDGQSYRQERSRSQDEDLDRIELVKIAEDLLRASNAHRIHYKHPRIRIVLPKISPEPQAELLPTLARIRSTGAILCLGPQEPVSQSLNYLRTETFPRLLPSPHPPLTDTLNIDCTILLALVSDLSHSANHPTLPGYNAAITRQIELETREHLLPSSLWPAMAFKNLVCTQEAAARMLEIVNTIGMPKEKSRTELLLANGKEERSGEDLRHAFATYSDYPIPANWRLPVRIVPSMSAGPAIRAAVEAGTLPSIAEQVAEQLTDINRSVFIYGWMQGVTTVSSNRTVAKQIEALVENKGYGAIGPDIWLREPARSLLGKEKERRG